MGTGMHQINPCDTKPWLCCSMGIWGTLCPHRCISHHCGGEPEVCSFFLPSHSCSFSPSITTALPVPSFSTNFMLLLLKPPHCTFPSCDAKSKMLDPMPLPQVTFVFLVIWKFCCSCCEFFIRFPDFPFHS